MTLESAFAKLFGREAPHVADAPGRVNLIGEHTDYNGGFVLPVALPLRTIVELLPRRDDLVRVNSAAMQTAILHFTLGAEKKTHTWLDYIQGTTVALRQRKACIRGFDARITSTVPVGAGLSSSAALEVSLLRALRRAFLLSLDDIELAHVARAVETEFVGAPVGVMDQMASSLGNESSALFLDTRSLAYERIPIPREVELLIIDSGVTHDHAAGEYRVRRSETSRAAALLGVTWLRDVGLDRMVEVNRLPSPLDRRARHVITENARVLSVVEAFRRRDIASLKDIFEASHRSMRDDFEISVPAVDRLVYLANKDPRIDGARLTGGGFGGAIVALAHAGEAQAAGENIAGIVGHPARVLLPSEVELVDAPS